MLEEAWFNPWWREIGGVIRPHLDYETLRAELSTTVDVVGVASIMSRVFVVKHQAF